MPVATAAAAPPLEPPGVKAALRGLSVSPCSSFAVNQRCENAGVLVRPMNTAPAFRQFATTAPQISHAGYLVLMIFRIFSQRLSV